MATYHPDTCITLGATIDPRRPEVDKSTNNYIIWKPNPPETKIIGGEIEFELSEVRAYSELMEKISLDVTAEAKFSLIKGKGAFKWEKEISFDETTAVFVFRASKKFMEEKITGTYALSKDGKEAWQFVIKGSKVDRVNRIINFQRALGTEMVTTIRRGSCISLIYIFRCSTRKQKEKISAEINLKWNTGSLDTKGIHELYRLDESLNFYVKGFQTGIGETDIVDQTLADIIDKAPGDIDSAERVLKNYLANISQKAMKSSPIIEYKSASLSDLPDILNSNLYNKFVELDDLNNLISSKCIELGILRHDNIVQLEYLADLLGAWNPTDFKKGSDKLIQNKMMEITKQNTELGKKCRECVNAQSEEDLNFFIIPPSQLSYADVILTPFIVPLKWDILTPLAFQDGHDLWSGETRTTFIPRIHIKYPVALREFYIKVNGALDEHFDIQDILKIAGQKGSLTGMWERKYITRINGIPWVEANIVPLNKQNHELNKTIDARNIYSLLIFLKDGTSHEVNIGTYLNPVLNIEAFFDNIPNKLISKVRKGK